MAQKCEICDRQTDFFEGVDYGDKCIFHCDKSDEAKWGSSESKDVKRFWRAIREKIRIESHSNSESHTFEFFIFPIFEESTRLPEISGRLTYSKDSFCLYQEENFWIAIDGDIPIKFTKEARFEDSIFCYKAIFDYVNFSISPLFESVLFKDECSFHFSKFLDGNPFFMLCKFNNYANFEKLASKNISFVDCDFFNNCTLNFAENTMLDEIELAYANFEKNAVFYLGDILCNNLKIIGLHGTNSKFINLRVNHNFMVEESILNNTNFSNIVFNPRCVIEINNTSLSNSNFTKIKWGEINENRFKIDRQMARQLKSINDAQGETVIANDFYALEMRLHSKELNWREHFGEKLVQNIHGLISNHSNDWALPTVWFFVFGLLFGTLARDVIPIFIVLSVFGLIGIGVVFADKIPTKHYKFFAFGFFAVSILFYSQSYASVEYVAALMNPLNIKDSKDLLVNTNLVLVYVCRIIEVFIGYQIITAIRKNTRRK